MFKLQWEIAEQALALDWITEVDRYSDFKTMLKLLIIWLKQSPEERATRQKKWEEYVPEWTGDKQVKDFASILQNTTPTEDQKQQLNKIKNQLEAQIQANNINQHRELAKIENNVTYVNDKSTFDQSTFDESMSSMKEITKNLLVQQAALCAVNEKLGDPFDRTYYRQLARVKDTQSFTPKFINESVSL